MNKNQTDPIVAVHDALKYLAEDAKALGAGDVAFYIGAAIQAVEEFQAQERLKRRSKRRSTPAK